MRIGFDVDGVLTNLEKYQLEYGKKYFKDAKNIDETAYDICDIFHCSREEREKFWTKYIWKYCLTEPIRKDAKKLIDKLKEEGHQVYIITGRAHTTEDNMIGALFRKMLETWLKKNDIQYDGIYYCSEDNNSDEKYNTCKELGIDIMIEDKKENIEKINEVSKVICVNSSYNKTVEDSIIRVDNFGEMYNWFVNNGIISENDNTRMFDKDNFKFTYGIVRGIGSPLFKTLLKPTIINREYIPEEGPILLCGNHLHVWDQFPVICSTKRTTHWMAKKEYFDGKMGPFFKKTGAICVDRFGNAQDSVNEALSYLNIGSAVGLFPEGTRNHVKQTTINDFYDKVKLDMSQEEFLEMLNSQEALLSQLNLLYDLYEKKEISKKDLEMAIGNIDLFLKNHLTENGYHESLLLPFKYGAVSMAKKTDVTIIPFSVTGDYKVGSDNLIVSFGEGFKVSDMSLEEANDKLRHKVLELLKYNKKM